MRLDEHSQHCTNYSASGDETVTKIVRFHHHPLLNYAKSIFPLLPTNVVTDIFLAVLSTVLTFSSIGSNQISMKLLVIVTAQ